MLTYALDVSTYALYNISPYVSPYVSPNGLVLVKDEMGPVIHYCLLRMH
jgi:hypothetical protein